MKISILGAGAFGLALASIFSENNNEVSVWSRFEEEVNYLKNYNTNEKIKNIFDVEADVLIHPKNKKPLIVF